MPWPTLIKRKPAIFLRGRSGECAKNDWQFGIFKEFMRCYWSNRSLFWDGFNILDTGQVLVIFELSWNQFKNYKCFTVQVIEIYWFLITCTVKHLQFYKGNYPCKMHGFWPFLANFSHFWPKTTDVRPLGLFLSGFWSKYNHQDKK